MSCKQKLIGACLGICLVLAGQAHAQQTLPTSPIASGTTAVSTEADAQGWLTDLVRINTSIPSGNELEAAKYIAGVLQKENIPAEVFEITPGRGVVIARLQSGPFPDASKALLLVGHLDEAGVTKEKWTVDPFGGVAKDGYLYGRGTLDDKGMVAANLATFIALKRSGQRLKRDVIFLADADEETLGPASLKTVISKYWDKIACGFALSEGGRVTVGTTGKVQYVGIQTSEKVPYDVTVTASGPAADASMPRADNAVTRLGTAIAKIGAWQPNVQIITVSERYFEQLAPLEDDETGKWMRALEMPERLDLAVRHLSDMNPRWSAMLRDTVVPTQLSTPLDGSTVPTQAQATLHVSLLPGNSVSPLIAQMQKLVNDPQVSFQAESAVVEPAPTSSVGSELYQAIEHAVPTQFPGAIALPMLSPDATDSSELRLHNVQTYGISPFPLSDAEAARIGGDDERISLQSFRTGIEFLYHMVHDFAVAP